MKKCAKCGGMKPLAEFNRNKSKAGGYNTECKACCVEYRKAYRSANKEKLKAADAAYYEKNKDRVAKTVEAYRKENAGKLKAAVARYRAENAETIDAYQAGYRARYKNENREKYMASKKAWELANPEARRLNALNRRAKMRAAGRLSKGIIASLLASQRGLCACCGEDLSETGYHVDHIMPIALGGSNTDDNVQLLTPACNLRKGSMHPEAYMQKRKSELYVS